MAGSHDNRSAAAFRHARALRERGQSREAAEQLRRMIEQQPGIAPLHYQLGACFEDINNKPAAAAEYRKAVEIDSGFAVAWHGIARVGKAPFTAADIETILGVQQQPGASPESIMLAGFALGRHFEQSGEHAHAAEQYLLANRTVRGQLNYDFDNDRRTFKSLKTAFDTEFLGRWADTGVPDTSPIFIVGMPRSGTTLVEQILASHANVSAGGELPFLIQAITSALPGVKGFDYVGALANAEASHYQAAANDYLQHLPAHDTSRITDKLPQNFLNIGMIRVLLPNARIVHCRRDARDTCFSVYKNLFGTHPYTFDLEELALYYNEYRALMKHWDEVAPGAIHTVDYERMIDDQAACTRELLDFCDLDWDDACLEFFRHDRSIPTISATQVQQPIYRSSVAAWRKYEDMLSPLLQRLDT